MKIKEARQFAQYYLETEGIADVWTIKFHTGTKNFGLCNYMDFTLSFSEERTIKSTRSEMQDVIAHEVAHTYFPYGYGHGPRWAELYKQLGGSKNYVNEKEKITS